MRKEENLEARRIHRLCEISQRDASRIDKKKYYGVKTNINKYKKEIVDTMYDPELFNKLVLEPAQSEALSDNFRQYIDEINSRISGLRDKIKEFLEDSYKKGTRRVLDRDGEPVKIGEVKDTRAIDFLIKEQEIYFKNLTEDQSKQAVRIVAKGIDRGTPVEQVADELQKSIKILTKSRATTIARSETVKAHNVGQVSTMQELGVETYLYITANDKKVAQICKDHQGPRSKPNIYQLEKAGTKAAPLPVINSHPNCRCTIVIHK